MHGGRSGQAPDAAAVASSAPRPLGTIAVLGFGNQGEAHALNLRDSGASVIVGARAGGAGAGRAQAHGFAVHALPDAAAAAATCSVMLPDEVTPALWPVIATALRPTAAVVFAHGFNLLYSDLAFASGADVVLVSPTGPGRVLRAAYQAGSGLPAYIAVHRDASGSAWAFAESYAAGIGSARARLWKTTVREETEVDLFGEQTVLCGGMNALVTAAFETLTARGYSPEIAYLECVHQLKFLADLLHERGVAGMRRGISGTALFGDLTRGPRVIAEPSRAALGAILDEIQSGAFAREWLDEVASGRRRLEAGVAEGSRHPIEAARTRALGQPGASDGGESRKALSKD